MPSGRTSTDPDAARRGGQGGQVAGRDVVAEQPGAGGVRVRDEQRPAVRGEVGAELAGQVDREFGLGVRGDVPDQQLLAAAALVQEQQPLVAGDRGERERGQSAAGAVGLLGDRSAVGDADHPDRGVPRVTVLGVGDGQQRLVLGERADPGVLGVGVDDVRGRVGRAVPQPDAGAVVRGRAGGDEPAADLQPGRVPVLDARQGRNRLGAERPVRRPRASRSRPANGSVTQCPNSSPSVSANHHTVSPSGGSVAMCVPARRSVTCRWVSVARSQA